MVLCVVANVFTSHLLFLFSSSISFFSKKNWGFGSSIGRCGVAVRLCPPRPSPLYDPTEQNDERIEWRAASLQMAMVIRNLKFDEFLFY